MADIYQRIWTADQEHNGLEALRSSWDVGDRTGYVKVDTTPADERNPDHRLLSAVNIPSDKSRTYDLCRRLFNNYALPERAREVDTPEERTERHELIEAIRDTPPMQVAREYIAERTGSPITVDRWHNLLIEQWFRTFEMGGDPELSGFEHVVVGEQEGSKVQGYHFWYKYYLDDGFANQVDGGRQLFPGLSDDRIVYGGSKAGRSQEEYPESVTIEYRWLAPDYDAEAVRPLYKKIGGFFVGCSVEGLMALGTVRAHVGANAPKTAVIEGARYDMKLFRSPNDSHIRTFYPIFQGGADPVTGSDVRIQPRLITPRPVEAGANGDVRIIAALVNPEGDDPGHETVTVVHAGPNSLSTVDWKIIDKNGNASHIDVDSLQPGTPHVVRLDGKGVQLSNKGGSIAIQDPNGAIVDYVTYSKAQASRPNATVIFQ